MKFNSKVLGILLVLLAIGMVITAASAADLVKNDFNGNFTLNISSDSYFGEEINSKMNFGDISMDLVAFENTGNDSSDIHTIFYFKDSSADKKMIADFIKDLEKDAKKVDKTGKYVVLETKNSESSSADISGNLDSALGFVDALFSSSGNINLSADGNQVSLSDNGLEVSDADGQNVSINFEGVSVSGNASDVNESFDVSSDFDVHANMDDCKYVVYLKDKGNSQVIVLSGNNLELLKSMAETASFGKN